MPVVICLHTHKCFQLQQFAWNNSIHFQSFLCTQLFSLKHCYAILIVQSHINHVFAQLNGFRYNKWFHTSIWSTDRSLVRRVTPDLSWPGSNSNEVELLIFQTSRTGEWLTICWFGIGEWVLRIWRDPADVFYTPSCYKPEYILISFFSCLWGLILLFSYCELLV